MSNKSKEKEEVYFWPSIAFIALREEGTEEKLTPLQITPMETLKAWPWPAEIKPPKLSEILERIREELNVVIKGTNWELSIKGYIEVGTGLIFPGGKTGFETTIKITPK